MPPSASRAIDALGGFQFDQDAARFPERRTRRTRFRAAQLIERLGIGAECTVAFRRIMRLEPYAALAPVDTVAAAPFHLAQPLQHRRAPWQPGAIDAKPLHHPGQLLAGLRVRAHEAPDVARRDPAVDQRALELALLVETIQFAAKLRPLSPAFDREPDPARQPGNGIECPAGAPAAVWW